MLHWEQLLPAYNSALGRRPRQVFSVLGDEGIRLPLDVIVLRNSQPQNLRVLRTVMCVAHVSGVS